MSLYKKATLVQIPSGYKAADAKLYSVVPNSGDGDFTVSSDADATRVNKDGLVETTVANQARLNYNFIDGVVQPDPHLLLEPTRTNNATYSNDISSWASVGSPTITTNITVAPDGSNTADGLQDATGGSFKRITRTISVSGNSTYTGRFFVKKETSETAYGGIMLDFINGTRRSTWVIFDAVNGTANNTTNSTLTPTIDIEDFGNYWRFSVTATDTGNNTSLIFAYFATMSTSSSGALTTGVGSVRTIWGAQLEEGNYPTSYIPTTTAAVTRTADTCINGGDANLFNDTEGVLFLDVEIPNNSSEVKQTSLNNGTTNEAVKILQLNGTTFRFEVVMSSGTNFSQDITVSPYQRNKLALQYKANEYKVFVNGEKQSVTQRSTLPTGLDRFNFNRGFSTTDDFSGKVHQAMIFNEALSDSELQTITSYDSFGQMAKALLYTIE